jgi:hypothetical protein
MPVRLAVLLLFSPLAFAEGFLPIDEGYSRFSGWAAIDGYYYDQSDNENSPSSWVPQFSLQPEFYYETDRADWAFSFVPYGRLTRHDNNSSSLDVREAYALYSADDWSVKAGVDREFWGVTESVNLVDIINQLDLAGNLGGTQKLGQPMVKVTLERSIGEFSAYLLPYFRTRTFPDQDSAFGSIPEVREHDETFESSKKKKHIDWALRWSHSVGDIDMALSYFDGTDRAPSMLVGAKRDGSFFLVPHYSLIKRAGLEFQFTRGSWLWKLEAIGTRSDDDNYVGAVGGLEYVLPSVFDSRADLSVFGEYLWDSRGEEATTPFENDVMVSARLSLNDTQSTEVSGGIIKDVRTAGILYNFQASTRLGEKWRIGLQARVYNNIPEREQLFGINQINFVNLRLTRFF